MSVLKRFRGESAFQVMTDAKSIRGLAIEWSMNEKHIPKRKRILFIEDLKNCTNSLVKNVRLAEKTFPYDEQTLELRKYYIQQALNDIEDIWDVFEFMDDVQMQANPIDWDSAFPCLDLLDREFGALKKWLDTSTIMTRKF